MICVEINEEGHVVASMATENQCQAFLITPEELYEYRPDPSVVVQFFGLGLSLVLGAFIISFYVGRVWKVVRNGAN